MSGRRLILRAGLAAGLIALHGLSEPSKRRRPRDAAGCRRAAGIARDFRCESSQHGHERQCQTARLCDRSNRPRRHCGFRPRSFTIAADDPGLQLLAARNEDGKAET